MEYLGFLPKILSAVSVGKAARRYYTHDKGTDSRNDKHTDSRNDTGTDSRNDKSTDSRNDTGTDSRNDKSTDSRNDEETSRRNDLLLKITRQLLRAAVLESGATYSKPYSQITRGV